MSLKIQELQDTLSVESEKVATEKQSVETYQSDYGDIRPKPLNAIAALIAYTYLLKKPTLKLRKLQDVKELPRSF